MEIQNSEPKPRPNSIKKAVNLFWASLLVRYIEMLTSFFMFRNDLMINEVSKILSVPTLIKFHLARLAIYVFLLFKILKGENWARIIVLAIIIIDVLTTVTLVPIVSSRSILLAGISITQIGLQCYAVFLLFFPSKAQIYFKTEYFSELARRMPLFKGKIGFLFFLLSLYMSYTGVVNLGRTGVFFAIPFLFFLVISSFDKKYEKPSRVFLAIFLSLYILKHMQTTVFFPAIGRDLYLSKDSCLEEHQLERSTYVRMGWLEEGEACSISTREGIIKVLKMNKGSKLIVTGTKVNPEAFVNEKYVLLAETPLGQLEYQVPTHSNDPRVYEFAKWSNGKDILEADMYRDIFKSPSELLWIFSKPFWFFIELILKIGSKK